MSKLATYDADGWELADAEEMHQQYPETFWIPDATERENLNLGDIVKLRFLILEIDSDTGEQIVSGERMWVKVAAREGDGYRGILDNESCYFSVLTSGVELYFEPRHIIDIWSNEQE